MPTFKPKAGHSQSKKQHQTSPEGSVSSGAGHQQTKDRTPSGGSGGILNEPDGADLMNEEIVATSLLMTETSPEFKSETRLDEVDGTSENKANRLAIELLQNKIKHVSTQIQQEISSRDSNVNKYLRKAPTVDEIQRQKMKTAFEKQNQKSGQAINALQKKLEGYKKKLRDLDSSGKNNRLKDVGQSIRGVVGNIKGAKDSLVSKPRDAAHHFKNKFGSVGDINASTDELDPDQLASRSLRNLDDDASSVVSGSAIQHTNNQATPNVFLDELIKQRDIKEKLSDRLKQLTDDFNNFKMEMLHEISTISQYMEDERFRYSNLEDQLNDLTELHQNEITNLRQEIVSASEKIEYQIDERTHDTHEILENCQTRITRMEVQNHQQQIISLDNVENVTFRTMLTKCLNVLLHVLAVVLIFVSTLANFIHPFFHTRSRTLMTVLLLTTAGLCIIYWDWILAYLLQRSYRLPSFLL